MGGLAFGDDFWSPSGTESDGGTHIGDRVRWEGTWKNCSLRPKKTPYSKISNFGVLKHKIQNTAFWCSFKLKENSQNWEKNVVKFLTFSGTKLSCGGTGSGQKGRTMVGWGTGKILAVWGDPQGKKPSRFDTSFHANFHVHRCDQSKIDKRVNICAKDWKSARRSTKYVHRMKLKCKISAFSSNNYLLK